MSHAAITRRAAVGMLAAAGAGFALFGPRPDSDRAARGRLVIDYWEKWTGHEGRAMQHIVDRYNQSQDRAYVRYFAMAGIDQKSIVAIAGGNPPDIIGMGNFSVPAYAESGAIMPLDDLAAAHSITPDRYAPAVWPMLTHKGRLYAIVNTCGALALFYNRAAFRDAGLDPDAPPRTISELDACHERLVRQSADGRLERVGFLHMEPDWWTWHWGYYFGTSVLTPEGDAAADHPANIRAYQWARSYPQRLGVERTLRFQAGFGFYGTPQHPFLAGQVAMTNQGPWLANLINAYKPDMDYAVAPFPVHDDFYDPDQPAGLLDSDVLVIPRGARHPEEAFRFIAFTQQPENVEFLSAAHCKNSPLATSSADFLASHPNPFVRVHAAVASSPRAFIFPRMRTWEQYVAEFNAAMQRIWRGNAEPAAALAAVRRAGQSQIDEARAAAARRATARAGSSGGAGRGPGSAG
ncbi:MAG: ABC transporter substrate-binding protein [Planctomycetota bacterium]|nr:ABC transporter substrate-binding protein [Planctomycetota bacterium]